MAFSVIVARIRQPVNIAKEFTIAFPGPRGMVARAGPTGWPPFAAADWGRGLSRLTTGVWPSGPGYPLTFLTSSIFHRETSLSNSSLISHDSPLSGRSTMMVTALSGSQFFRARQN